MNETEQLFVKEVAAIVYVPEEIYSDFKFYENSQRTEKVSVDRDEPLFLMYHRERYGNSNLQTWRCPHLQISYLDSLKDSNQLIDIENKIFNKILTERLGIEELLDDEKALVRNTSVEHNFTHDTTDKEMYPEDTINVSPEVSLKYFLLEFLGPHSRLNSPEGVDMTRWIKKSDLKKYCYPQEYEGIQKVLEKWKVI